VGEPAHAAREAAPRRDAEDLLGQLGHALEDRRPARQHRAGREDVLQARLGQLLAHVLEDLLHARRDDVHQHRARQEPPRPPTDGTSNSSSLLVSALAAQLNFCLIFSAASSGVRSPTAMSLVRWLPPSGSTLVWTIAPSSNTAMSVVPPPTSTIATPSSFSSS